MGEEFWKEVEEHLSVVQGNLGICCQDYCDAADAMASMEIIMEKLVDIKEKYE